MNARKIVVIDGHPDPDPGRYGHALADAYAEAATGAGHEVRRVVLAEFDIPILRDTGAWRRGALPDALVPAQEAIGWAGHLVLVYPLWMGSMPALAKAFIEQMMRPGFAVPESGFGISGGLLRGRSARIIVTMGMPAAVFRLFYFSHSLSTLRRNILMPTGIGPVRATLIGSIDAIGDAGRRRWLEKIGALGRAGE